MYSPNLGIGAVGIVYALSQLDEIIQHKGAKKINGFFASDFQNDLTLCACFIQENVAILEGKVTALGKKNLADQRVKLNETTKQRFFSILHRAAREHEGISRQERIFIQKFWFEIQQLFATSSNA